ncbi:MAG: NMD3-related protein [Candidatus Woesearchaeota archaeon]
MELSLKNDTFIKCPKCDRTLVEGRWSKQKSLQALSYFLDKSIVEDYWRLDGIIPPIEVTGKLPKKISLRLIYNNDDDDYETVIQVNVKNRVCEDCHKSTGQYFEGYLQLRNASSDQIVHAKKLVGEKGSIKKEKIRDGNADFTVSSNKAIIHAIRELSKHYNGISNVTSKLHTKDKQSSKEKHRITGLYKFLGIGKNDIVVYEESYYIVRGIGTKKIMLESIGLKQQKKSVPIGDYGKMSIVNAFSTTIIRTAPVLMVLDEHYQPSPAYLIGKLDKNEKEVRAVRTNEGLFILES